MYILVKITEHMVQNRAAARTIQYFMKFPVILVQLFKMPMFQMIACHKQDFLSFFQLLTGNIFCRPPGAKTFKERPDRINIFHILTFNTAHISAFIRDRMHQPFQLKLPDSLTHRCPADAVLPGNGIFP